MLQRRAWSASDFARHSFTLSLYLSRITVLDVIAGLEMLLARFIYAPLLPNSMLSPATNLL